VQLLRWARMKNIYQEDTHARVSTILPLVQLMIVMPQHETPPVPLLSAASVARGCEGRRTPLLIFDLAHTPSVDELAGLLPAVCLYTPEDLRTILSRAEMKAS